MTCIAWTHQGLRLVTGSLDKAVVCQNVQAGPTVQVRSECLSGHSLHDVAVECIESLDVLTVADD